MNPAQDDIIDELYFVTAFTDLKEATGLPEEMLCKELKELVDQELVKCFFPHPDTEATFSPETFSANCRQYFFLATKKGLLAHNSR